MYIFASLSKLATVDKPVEIKKSEPLCDPLLSGVKSCREILLSNRFWSNQAPHRLSKQECCSCVKCKAEKQWLKVDHPTTLFDVLDQVINSSLEEFQTFILSMLQLRP